MLKEFIENTDTSMLPIGPQAELVESLRNLNNCVPWHLKSEKSLSITKKFRWKHGTYDNVQDIRSGLLGIDKRYNNIMDIFEKPLKRNYSLIRFKRYVQDVNNTLVRKRYNGDVWTDDENVVEQMKTDAITKIIELFNDYKNYVTMINKSHNCDDNVEYIMYDHPSNKDFNPLDPSRVPDVKWEKFINNELASSYQFNTHTSKIILRKSTNDIYIIHPFKDINMNVYASENTSPMYRYNIGHVLMMYEISVKSLFTGIFKCGGKQLPNNRTRFWYKPLIQGNRHPYLNYHDYENSSIDPELWGITINTYSNACFGNMGYLYGQRDEINLIKMFEIAHTWLSSYRDGITHPLNDVYSGYYGHPSFHDPNVTQEYYDRIGIHKGACYERLHNSLFDDVSGRQDICMTQCVNEVRDNCRGFKHDVRVAKENIIAGWNVKDRRNLMHKLDLIKINFDSNLDFNFNPDDDNYPVETIRVSTVPDPSLENEMLEWVRNQNS